MPKLGTGLCLSQQHRDERPPRKELADAQATKKGISALGRAFGLVLTRLWHPRGGGDEHPGVRLAQPQTHRCGRVCLDAWQSWMGG